MEAAANMEDLIIHQDPDYAEVGPRCDTHLTTEDGTVFNVDSKLLSRHSKFFKNLFLEVEEAGQSTVIRHIKPDIFKIILTYLNTGEVLLTAENIIDLLVASDFLMIESLLDKCRKFALQNKKVENILSFFLTANKIKGLGMEHQCRRYLVMCFEKAVMNSMDEACCLPYEELKYFLSHRSLNVSDEHTIWSVIEAWVQKDPVDRHPLVPELLRCLSIHEIGDELASNILSSPIIRNNICYRDVEDVTFDFLFRNQLSIITEVRLPRFLHVVAKLFQDRDGAELFLSYDDNLDLWRKVGKISLKGGRIFVSGHLVYYLKRGLGHYEFSGSYYDLLKNEEKCMELPDITNYVVGEVGGCVYVLDIYEFVIQRYVHESDEWMDVRLFEYNGCISGALNLNGLLHVIDEEKNKIFMWVYDPSKDEWKSLPSPTVRRKYTVSAVYQGKIFLVAGEFIVHNEELNDEDSDEDVDVDEEEGDPNAIVELDLEEQDEYISKDVEVYDPQSNEWVIYPELPIRFHPLYVSISVVKDRLYVYQNPQRPVTYWDGSEEWKIAENPSQFFHHKFGAVKDEDVVRKIMKRNKEEVPTVWMETGLDKEIL